LYNIFIKFNDFETHSLITERQG